MFYSILTWPSTDRLRSPTALRRVNLSLFRDPVSGNLVVDFVSFRQLFPTNFLT